jgi:hypothetical protein
MVAMAVTSCYGNTMVAMESQLLLWTPMMKGNICYGCYGKSIVAMDAYDERQYLLWESLVAKESN